MSTVEHTAMIETSYLGPTNCRGSRVSARVVSNHKTRLVVPWDHALGSFENHERAARALADKLEKGALLYSSSVDGCGYVFTVASEVR